MCDVIHTEVVLQLKTLQTLASDACRTAKTIHGVADNLAKELRSVSAIYPLLASAWFYGGWVAETKNERDMQALMEQHGWWPIKDEAELLVKLAEFKDN